MPTHLGTVGEVLALLISFTVLAGLVARFILLPWLRDQLAPTIKKVEDTHRTLTVNGHVSREPTVLDKLDQLSVEFREFKGESRSDRADLRSDIRTMGRMFDGHLDWSAQEVHTIWDHLRRHRHDAHNHMHTDMSRELNTQRKWSEHNDAGQHDAGHSQRD